MLEEMSYQQLQEWKAYAILEPFDEERADMRSAEIVATIMNIMRSKGSQPIESKDVTLRYEGNPKPVVQKSWQEIQAIGMQWAKLYGAEVKDDVQPG